VEGKTVTETFSTDAALRKAQREVEEYHRFRRLSQELLEGNEQICRLRPILAEASAEEKKNRGSDPGRNLAGAKFSLGSDLRWAAPEWPI
jgi:hypothetical protein